MYNLNSRLICVQDAHEFLGQVLDQLKDEVDKLIKDEGGSSPDRENDGSILEETYPNPTARNFEFEVLHTITCSG